VKSQAGWLGRLQLVFERTEHASQLSRSLHEGPLRIQRVLHPEGRRCPHVYLLHPPGGVVGGDRLETIVSLGPGAEVLLTTPAAQKLYRSAGATASISNLVHAAEGACVDWLPSETLAFSEARAMTTTRVHLAAGASFLGWDVACYGMPARGETFSAGRVASRFELYREETPLLIESLDLDGSPELLSAPFALRGAPVVGNLYAVPGQGSVADGVVELVRQVISSATGAACAVSSLGELLVVRALGPTVEAVRAPLLAAWQALRPALTARAATLPRIWAT
jgi:urease accessory protein